MKLVIESSSTKSVEPDWMDFTVKCIGEDLKDKNQSTKNMLENVKKASNFVGLYFDSDMNMTTSDISIKELYDYRKVQKTSENGNLIYEKDKVFKGYLSAQILKFACALDVELALKTIISLGKKDNIEVYVSYCMKDSDKVQNEVMLSALDIAKSKADVIASHMDVHNVEFISIDYTHTPKYGKSKMSLNSADCLCMSDDYSDEFELAEDLSKYTKPENIIFTEHITANFELY